ncbi:hypothetical protein GF336_00660 [Candidatus Woesearchaeota archaeon]|nr:hypothetical protein [Candidatus Woesearchaeota archaeon]
MKKLILIFAIVILMSSFASAALTDGLVSYWDFDEGNETIAEDSSNYSSDSFQVQLKEQKSSGSYNPQVSFSKPDSDSLRVSSTNSGIGRGIFFQSFDKDDIDGQTVKLTWETWATLGTMYFNAIVMDGAYDRSSSSDFPSPGWTTKGNGTLQIIESLQGTNSEHTVSLELNLENSTEDNVTIMLYMSDSWIGYQGSYTVHSLGLYGDGVLDNKADLDGTLNMESTGGVDDYGVLGENSEYGNDGTLNGIPSWISGKLGDGLDFDGSNDYVSLADDIIETGADSVCAWIYPTGWGEGWSSYGYGRIVDNGNFIFNINEENEYLQFSSDGASNSAYSGANSISLNTWHHVCATRDSSGDANIYIDGSLSGLSDQNSGTPAAGTSSVYIGDRSSGGRAFDGKIDEVSTWNRALSSLEVSQLYNSGDGFNPFGYEVTEPSSWNGFDLYDSEGNVVGPTTTYSIHYIQEGSDKKVEFEINDDVDLSGVTADADSSRTVVANLGSVSGVIGTHSLYVPITEATGVYVCPDAEILSEVVEGCTNEGNFSYSECDSITEKNIGGDTVTCEIIGTDYKVSGLTGSGGGETPLGGDGDPAVPEFSTIGMILAVLIAIVGIALVVKKKK